MENRDGQVESICRACCISVFDNDDDKQDELMKKKAFGRYTLSHINIRQHNYKTE